MKPEQMQEGWVSFKRYPCKEGHIDIWRGDCNSDPNDPSKAHLNLNSFAVYMRCNGGKWIHSRYLGGGRELIWWTPLRLGFTAEEIWEELINPK